MADIEQGIKGLIQKAPSMKNKMETVLSETFSLKDPSSFMNKCNFKG